VSWTPRQARVIGVLIMIHVMYQPWSKKQADASEKWVWRGAFVGCFDARGELFT